MQFHNASVDINALPSVNNAEWQPIERKYLTVLRIQWLIFSVFLLAIAAFFVLLTFPGTYTFLIFGSCVVIIAFYFAAQEKAFQYKAYCLRQHDIMYRSGWIIRTVAVCPFNRIQHCNMKSGPLERNYGLASVTVYTAGAGSDLRIPGLPETTAASVREFIMKKISVDEPENN
jgi:uncharacterized protein